MGAQVPVLDPVSAAPGFRALLSGDGRGGLGLRAVAVRGAAARHSPLLVERGMAPTAVPALFRWLSDHHLRLESVLRSLREPRPPPEYAEAHEFLVERHKRSADGTAEGGGAGQQWISCEPLVFCGTQSWPQSAPPPARATEQEPCPH